MITKIDKQKVRLWMLNRRIDTYKELAQKANITEATLHSVLDSNRFTGKTLDAVAQALEVNPMDLLYTEGYPNPLVAAPTRRAEPA